MAAVKMVVNMCDLDKSYLLSRVLANEYSKCAQ